MSRHNDKFIKENFTELELNLNNLSVFQVRKNILTAVKNTVPEFHGTVLDVGCGIMPYRKIILQNKQVVSYIGMDLENSDYYNDIKPDILWNGRKIPMEDRSVDCIMATEVLEHCFEPQELLNEIFRVLKPGGMFFCTVPFIWHLHEIPHDAYRYTPYSLEKLLSGSGFKQISVKATGGWDSALSQMLGLWVTYRPTKRIMKSILLRVVYMLIKRLSNQDRVPVIFNNKENSMVSGLYATCRKDD